MNFPANPLLQLVPSRVPQAVARLRAAVWKTVATVTEISATAPSPEIVGFSKAQSLPRKRLASLPQHYGKLWDQRWFCLKLPKVRTGERLYLHWQDQAEATLYIHGTPHYGFDVAHSQAPLPAGASEVWVESVVSQTGIWHPNATGLDPKGSLLQGATLVQRDDLVWSVLHDFLVLDDLMREELRAAFPTRDHEFAAIGTKPALGVIPPLLRRLLRFLDDAINALDASGVAAAKTVLNKAFKELKSEGQIPAAILTGHAHIDLVWMWPERVGEFKAVHTFAIANRLLQEYPDMHFAYSQPASYAAVKRLSPAITREVQKRIREGRWEAQGATEVESDTLLACGEALARSFLLGQEGFREITGKPSPILWLPDVFGYSGCLPQLMVETGVEFFFTTKLTWNAITPFPYSSFVWTGADGSEVVSHICQNNGYNQTVSSAELRRGAAAHRQCDVHPEFLAPTGYGDGGGGVTEEMCERAKRVAKLAGIPETRWGRLDTFFRKLGTIKEQLPVYRGELYFEYHRGTYTTHAEIKAALRLAERSLQIREAVRSASGRPALDASVWKRVVFAQFHDYIPGSSCHEVYDEARAELKQIAESTLESAASELGRKGTSSLFNPLPHPRIHRTGKTHRVIPPLTGSPISELPTVELPDVHASEKALSNERVTARFDTSGRIRSLVVDGHEVDLTQPANELVLYPEHPHLFEAWDIDRQALSLGKPDTRKAAVKVGSEDVTFSRPLGKSSHVQIRYWLEPGSPVLRIAYDLDWREEHMLLKAVFPTGFLGRDARYGAPFGSVRRPQLGGSQSAEAMWEVPASRWAVVCDDSESEGFFCVTESKFGFSCREGQLGVSLVRSARITSEDRGNQAGSHPEPIRRTLAPQVVSDLGRHRIEIAVGAFDPNAPREEHPSALADLLFTPCLPYEGAAKSCGFLGLEGGDSLQPTWAIPGTKNSWTLRLHETLGRSGQAKLILEKGWSAKRVDLSGKPLRTQKSLRTIDFSPYKVISLEISKA